MSDANRNPTTTPATPTPPGLSPGPWQKTTCKIVNGEWVVILDANDHGIAILTEHAFVDVEANGTAIQAVPAMLAALIEAESIMSRNVYPCPDKPQSAWGVLCRVREAIKAATTTNPE